MTVKQKEVLRKIIYAVETGGQVYGKQDYSDFTGAYTNSADEHSITIGAGQWYGPEAQELLQRIHDADVKAWENTDRIGLYENVEFEDWDCFAISKHSQFAELIVKLISTQTGIKCQDEFLDEQMEEYCKEAEKLGVAEPAAQAMCANFRHQGGYGAVTRILAKTPKPYTLDALYNSCQSDTGNQVGAYKSRQKFVYESLKKYFAEAERDEGNMTKTEKAIRQMEAWAKDNSHGYDQIYRWGEKGDYDCSSAVISAWELAGVPVKTKGATYTGDMYYIFVNLGFKDVTRSVNLATGAGLQRGDVLLNEVHHVAMYCGNGKEVEASINENGGATGGKPGDQTGAEFLIRSYRNYPWDCVLRYPEAAQEVPDTPVEEQKEDTRKTTVAYPARMAKDTKCYLGAGTGSGQSKMFPLVKKETLVDVMSYTEKDSSGKTWYFIRIPHPTEGFVFEFVPAGSFRHLK